MLLLKNEEIKPNIRPGIPQYLSLWRRPVWPTLSKSLDIISATAQVPPDLLNALKILLDTTIRGFAIEQGDLKPEKKSESWLKLLRWARKTLLTS